MHTAFYDRSQGVYINDTWTYSGVLYILHSCRVIGRNACVHVNFSSSFLGTTLTTCDPCCSRDSILASTAEGSQVSLSGLPE